MQPITGKFRQTPQARRVLLEIWLYIAADSESAADKLLDRVDGVLAMLARSSKAGRARPELGPGIRSFPLANYVLFYRAVGDDFELVRFLNARLDIDSEDMAVD